METKFFALLTTQGAAKLANATALGTKLNISEMAVGDGDGELQIPDPAQTTLKNEVRRAPLNSLSVDAENDSQIIAEQIIPEDEGGFWIRELGLYDEDGVLIAVANCPETYKPQLQEGSGRTQAIRMILIVSSTDSVTLKVDPSVVLATKGYVDSQIIEVKNYIDEELKKYLKIENNLSEIATAGEEAQAIAREHLGIYGGLIDKPVVIKVSGAYVPSPSMRLCRVRIVAGGGAGGSVAETGEDQIAIAAGGGAGAYAEGYFTREEIGDSIDVTVGAGGVAALDAIGGAGEASKFGNFITCPGGQGAMFCGAHSEDEMFVNDGGMVSVAPEGTFTYGFRGQSADTVYYMLSLTQAGHGASSPLGTGGGVGSAGSGFGSGGGGVLSNHAPAALGSNGAPGVCIIEEYA